MKGRSHYSTIHLKTVTGCHPPYSRGDCCTDRRENLGVLPRSSHAPTPKNVFLYLYQCLSSAQSKNMFSMWRPSSVSAPTPHLYKTAHFFYTHDCSSSGDTRSYTPLTHTCAPPNPCTATDSHLPFKPQATRFPERPAFRRGFP